MPRARFLSRRIRRAAILPVAASLLALAIAAVPGRAADEALSFTVRTIDNDAGVRVVVEFSRKPNYEVRSDGRRVYVTLREGNANPPFHKKDYSGAMLERIKFVTGMRTSEIVLYTGPEFGTFSTFEMGEPFRLVVDLRRRPAPGSATRVPTPAPLAAGAAGMAQQTPPGAPGQPLDDKGAGAVPAGGANAPPAAAAAPEGAHGKSGFTVVVDPGHGGEEEGARGPTGLHEKDVTLDVARRLRTRLQSEPGTQVLLTRDDDRTLPLDDRTSLANHAHADLFVSIHANSSRREDARGSETYFLSYQATDDESRAVAALENNALRLDEGVQGQSGLEMILWDMAQSAYLKASSDLAEMIQDRLNDTLGVRNRGIKQAPFRVLMGATMPAVLVEIAFISSPEEEKRLRDPGFKDQLAQAIGDSIHRYREKFPQ